VFLLVKPVLLLVPFESRHRPHMGELPYKHMVQKFVSEIRGGELK
jgi:hypothetical protein